MCPIPPTSTRVLLESQRNSIIILRFPFLFSESPEIISAVFATSKTFEHNLKGSSELIDYFMHASGTKGIIFYLCIEARPARVCRHFDGTLRFGKGSLACIFRLVKHYERVSLRKQWCSSITVIFTKPQLCYRVN